MAIEELEASCLVGVGEVDVQNHDGKVGEDWEHVLLCEHTILPALNLSLGMNGVILEDDDDDASMVIMYLNLESKVCMNTSNLFGKTPKSGHSRQSLLSLTA